MYAVLECEVKTKGNCTILVYPNVASCCVADASSAVYSCVSLNKEIPKATKVIAETERASWNQTFVFSLSDTLPLPQQTLSIQIFNMELESSISTSVGLRVLSLEALMTHHNDVEWFRILLYFDLH